MAYPQTHLANYLPVTFPSWPPVHVPRSSGSEGGETEPLEVGPEESCDNSAGPFRSCGAWSDGLGFSFVKPAYIGKPVVSKFRKCSDALATDVILRIPKMLRGSGCMWSLTCLQKQNTGAYRSRTRVKRQMFDVAV
jgi:hypothetical protein